MCDPVSISIAVASAVVSTATSVAGATSQAKQQADAQADANQRMAEQSAAEATAANIKANVAANQRAAALTREQMDIAQSAAQTRGSNVVEFSEAGVQGNFVSDVSDALAFEESTAAGAATVQHMFANQAAGLTAADTAQGHAQTMANLDEGSIDYGSSVISGVIGGISGGISTGLSASSAGIGDMFGGGGSTAGGFASGAAPGAEKNPLGIGPIGAMPWD
jgi:hypothetical protein